MAPWIKKTREAMLAFISQGTTGEVDAYVRNLPTKQLEKLVVLVPSEISHSDEAYDLDTIRSIVERTKVHDEVALLLRGPEEPPWERVDRIAKTPQVKALVRRKDYVSPIYPKTYTYKAKQLLIGMKPTDIAGEGVTKKEAHDWLTENGGQDTFIEWLQATQVPEVERPQRSLNVVRWLIRQKERGQLNKLFAKRILHGPAGQEREYTFDDILDEIQDEDLIRGPNTRIEDAFQHAAERMGEGHMELLSRDFKVIAKPPPWLHSRYKKSVTPLITPAALVQEGQELEHCVGGYVQAVQKGQSVILALRVGDQRSTAEVSPDARQVYQHRGPRNAEPAPVLQRLLKKVLARAQSTARNNPYGVPWWEAVTGCWEIEL